MKKYILTVFDSTGEKLLDETFEAVSDQEAKSKGEEILHSKDYMEYTHRCTSPTGSLILFHR